MYFDLEKKKAKLKQKIRENSSWVFDPDLCIVGLGVTRYNVSLDDRERRDNQHIISINVPNFELAIALLSDVANLGGSVINGLGQSYNSLIQKESENFVLNIYEYSHTDLAENYPLRNRLL